MQLIKEKIKYNRSGGNIKISLDSNINLNGNQEVLNKSTDEIANLLVNESLDGERWRFKYDPTTYSTLTFRYGLNKITNYTEIGFTSGETEYNYSNFANSFYILDFYDSFDENNQNKLFRTFLTIKSSTSVFYVGKDPNTLNTLNNQISTLFVPQWVMNNYTTNIADVYVKFSFYNASLGKLHLFYNSIFLHEISSRKMYFKVNLNGLNKTWFFNDNLTNIITGIELINSGAYTDKVNNNVTNSPNIEQDYQTGALFNYNTGKYTN